MKKLLLLGAMMVLVTGAAQATLYSTTYSSGFNSSGVIPDGNAGGWSDTRTISGIPFLQPADVDHTDQIVDVNVRLTVTGGYNGDLYGYLVHSSGFAVLLNRVGRDTGNAFGYADSGLNLTLDDSAANNIHTYQTVGSFATLIGNGSSWAPDGRNVDPALVVTGDSPTGAQLANFNTLSANGTWTLFLADLASGDTSTVTSWGLDISVVPEPVDWALGIFGGMLGLVALVRGWRKHLVPRLQRAVI